MGKGIEILLEESIKNKIIKKEDQELYRFGVRQLISFFINIISTVLISMALHVEKEEAITFFLSYHLLRSYAGGVHAKTEIRCYIYSVILIIGALFFIKNIDVPIGTVIAVMIVSSVFILILSPVDTENKRLDNVEIRYFKRATCMLILGEHLFFYFCIYMGKWKIVKSITVAVVLVLVVLVIGVIVNLWETNLHYKHKQIEKLRRK